MSTPRNLWTPRNSKELFVFGSPFASKDICHFLDGAWVSHFVFDDSFQPQTSASSNKHDLWKESSLTVPFSSRSFRDLTMSTVCFLHQTRVRRFRVPTRQQHAGKDHQTFWRRLLFLGKTGRIGKICTSEMPKEWTCFSVITLLNWGLRRALPHWNCPSPRRCTRRHKMVDCTAFLVS